MNTFSNLNLAIPDLWEVRDVINKVKNVVLNYTEMEAKVHDATNNEAWGASSTVMQEIAQATFNYQYFNEIMPTIYKRFTEKEAKQWRQIYKSLVLLEYLVKNGSERVVDDARSHVSMIKMMKNFHYVDEKGKDQGMNVRNRAKELAELLGDVDTIKAERKKAKKNRNKYTGVGSEGGMMFSSGGSGGGYSSGGIGSSGMGGGGSRYEGFGSESNYSSGGGGSGSGGFGSDDYNSTSYGNGGYGNSSDFFDDERPGRYDDDDSPSISSQRRGSKKSDSLSSSPAPRRGSNTKSTSKPKTAKEMNLFDFDEPVATTSSNTKKANDDDWGDFAEGDDDFDDFQSAPTQQTRSAAPLQKPAHSTPAKKSNDIFDLLGDDNTFTSSSTSSPVVPQQQQTQPHNLMLSQGISFDTLVASNSSASSPALQPMNLTNAGGNHTPVMQQQQQQQKQQQQSSTDNTPMGGIWSQASISLSLDSLGSKAAPAKPAQGPSMNALKNNSVNAGWNNWATANTSQPQQQQQQQQQQPAKQSSVFDDLLL